MTAHRTTGSPPAAVLGSPRPALRFERHLTTDLDDAWTLVSDPERVARWFAPVTVGADGTRPDTQDVAEDLAENARENGSGPSVQDAVGRTWTTYWDDGREYATGTIVRCEPPRLLELTWTASDDADASSAGSVLRVTLTEDPAEDGAGVLLTLEHEGLGATDLVLYGAGWHTYLDRLGDGSIAVVDWSARFAELEPVYRRLVEAVASSP